MFIVNNFIVMIFQSISHINLTLTSHQISLFLVFLFTFLWLFGDGMPNANSMCPHFFFTLLPSFFHFNSYISLFLYLFKRFFFSKFLKTFFLKKKKFKFEKLPKKKKKKEKFFCFCFRVSLYIYMFMFRNNDGFCLVGWFVFRSNSGFCFVVCWESACF